MRDLLIATNNPGKLREFRDLLDGLPLRIVAPADIGLSLEVEETGATFEENARLKALAFAQASGRLALADDSGLEVDALGGAPGVYSARYGGPGLTDEDRVQKLIQALEGIPRERRTARFRAVIAVADPDRVWFTTEGVFEGWIGHAPRGRNGFGYDPVFELPDDQRTSAELDPTEKNRRSHRGQAARQARDRLVELIASPTPLTPTLSPGEREDGPLPLTPSPEWRGGNEPGSPPPASGEPERPVRGAGGRGPSPDTRRPSPDTLGPDTLSHFDAAGRARMVDVSEKAATAREAVARGRIVMAPATLARIREGGIAKGDVLAVAQVGGIMAAKQTPQIIPMCHPLLLGGVDIEFALDEDASAIEITARVKTTGQTGAEMEALTAVSVAALTIYDMCKAIDKRMRIEAVRLAYKSGGKSGTIDLEADDGGASSPSPAGRG